MNDNMMHLGCLAMGTVLAETLTQKLNVRKKKEDH